MTNPVFADGYTIPFKTDGKLVNSLTGEVIYGELPVIEGRYRPPTYDEREEFLYKHTQAPSGLARARIVKEFICAHIASWNATFSPSSGATPVELPRDAELIGKYIPEPIINMLLDKVCRWGPGSSQGQDAGNSSRA